MGEAQAQGGRPVRPLQFLGPARLQLIIAAMQIERHANTKSSKLQAFASRALALVARDSEAGATAVLDADAVEPLPAIPIRSGRPGPSASKSVPVGTGSGAGTPTLFR